MDKGEFLLEEVSALHEFADFGLQFGPVVFRGFAVLPRFVGRGAEFPADLVRKEFDADGAFAAGPGFVDPTDGSAHL